MYTKLTNKQSQMLFLKERTVATTKTSVNLLEYKDDISNREYYIITAYNCTSHASFVILVHYFTVLVHCVRAMCTTLYRYLSIPRVIDQCATTFSVCGALITARQAKLSAKTLLFKMQSLRAAQK